MATSSHNSVGRRATTPDDPQRPSRGAHSVVPEGHPESSWEALLETLPAAFYLDRPDGTSIWVSPQIEAILGCTREEWSRGIDAWADRIHPGDRGRVMRAADEFVRTGSPESDEYRVVLPDGRVRWIHDRALLLHGGRDGEPVVHGIIVDVTEARASLEVAERAGRLFRALVENAAEAVTIVNGHGVVVYQNPTMGRVVGRPAEWFAGRTPLDLMPPEDAARAREILAMVQRRPGAKLPGEFRLRHRDGSWRVVSGVATNLLHDPAVRGIVLNYRDVTDEQDASDPRRDTDRRRVEQLELMLQAEDEDRMRLAEEFHDDTLQVMAAALVELDRGDRHLDRGDVIAARAAFAGARTAVHEATERTRRLTFQLGPQLLGAAGLAPAVRDLADNLARHTGATVAVRAPRARFATEVETLAYRTVREAVLNVRRHARARNVEIHISRRRGMLHGSVKDDGRGFRTGARSRRRDWRQIGLESARERLRIAGGTLDVTSAPGQGTTLAFRIPLPHRDLPVAGDEPI